MNGWMDKVYIVVGYGMDGSRKWELEWEWEYMDIGETEIERWRARAREGETYT